MYRHVAEQLEGRRVVLHREQDGPRSMAAAGRPTRAVRFRLALRALHVERPPICEKRSCNVRACQPCGTAESVTQRARKPLKVSIKADPSTEAVSRRASMPRILPCSILEAS
jgi:hypothetical protein